MPPSSETQAPSKASNLTRIRDNQRRSRARRKEYLAELESKLSNCERVGVEASAEIQMAARRVMEENRRLRALMARHGIEVGGGEAAGELEGMLGRRRECGGGAAKDEKVAVPRLAPTDRGPDSLEESVSPAIASTSGSVHSAAPSQTPWSLDESAPDPTMQHNSMANYDNGAGTMNLAHYDDPHAYYASLPFPNAHMPDADLYGLDDFPDAHNFDEPNHSSCRSVAGAIRSIRPDIGGELEEDLGCQSGEDCSVSNLMAFDVIDRYSGGTGTGTG